MTYQAAINQEIGGIIKTVQYIEWNLLNQLGRDTFEAMTLGQIIDLVRRKNIIDNSDVDELKEILRKRNDLVHGYFKRQDFEKHSNNQGFLENQLKYLQNFSRQVDNFNDWLCND